MLVVGSCYLHNSVGREGVVLSDATIDGTSIIGIVLGVADAKVVFGDSADEDDVLKC